MIKRKLSKETMKNIELISVHKFSRKNYIIQRFISQWKRLNS